ncbi:hypothetical protein A3I40_01165 [Candidatus Uhrbacteria bacterium RIFCSPLOWO2_02_FULL_48_12]|uniref:D-alanine--D-alanine ligase n=1 Tax=Candidatus Uhrbacteria bacterium RIFCSPLOWO2_02_FULL_48_12 TaxID=1802407 RepID=A0A1F7VBY9_9BACT|nr:MAG: hypothetical protein A3I40_01165 [Candidatus Uhrbacteria bacterium RIFCSPLOWO2_02_FULL_48_12]
MDESRPKKIRVGVFFGGRSSEREVSLTGGRHVYQMLDQSRYEPVAIYWDTAGSFWEIPETLVIRNTTKEIEERLTTQAVSRISFENLSLRVDIAFLVTHGKYGDDGCLQGLLELMHLPYTGSGVLAAALGMDKIMSRKLMRQVTGIGLPEYITINHRQWMADQSAIVKMVVDFGFPAVIKPAREGSTFGVSVARAKESLPTALNAAFAFDNNILVERYIKGKEFSCIVIGNDNPEAFIPTETEHQGEIFTYEEKYLPGGSNKITPIRVSDQCIAEIQRQAVLTYQVLGFVGYARIDGFVMQDEQIIITDPNGAASTGMGPSSWTFHQAAAAGFTIPEFLHHLIELGWQAHRRKKGPL